MHRPDQNGIRAFRETDLAPVGRLIRQTIEACYGAVYPPRAVRFFKEFHSDAKILERHEAGEILVIEQDGRVVATGAFVDGDIFGVFVDPRCQQQGHGRTLMRALEARALANGHSEAVLSVSLPSRGFYEGLGYQVIEDCSKDMGHGEALAFWRARKALSEADP